MIYLNNTTEAQAVFIPRDTSVTGALRFKARSTVGLDVPVTVAMLDLDGHRLCYQLAITLPEGIASGEYEYELTAGGIPVSTGVMVVRDGLAKPEEYNKTIEYEQYEGQ
jgi:hypothetical protein